MTRTRTFAAAALAVVLGATVARTAPDVAPPPRPGVDLTGYKTVAAAIKANPKEFNLIPAPKVVSPGFLGVVIGEKNGKAVIEAVAPESPADKAGVKEGDVVVKIDAAAAASASAARDLLRGKLEGDKVRLTLARSGKTVEATATLKATSKPMAAPEPQDRPTGKGGIGGGVGGGWNDRLPRAWAKPTYRLAILGVEYPDVKHNPKIKDSDWEESMFSLGTYTGKSATGQPVYGSMNDFYKELSYGAFKVEGKFLGWVEVSKKRLDYTTGTGTTGGEKSKLLTEAMEVYSKKHGKDWLKEYDGIFFLYAGDRVQTNRGGLYWPHRANVRYDGNSYPYFIVQEGGTRMNDISVFCHEFGHMLGLPDLYARPENPGSEGVGVWCAMSNQIGGGRPQHFSAWCKEQLGWIKPTVIDPRVKQKIVLGPIEDDPTQCLKVAVRTDGREYYLLENRKKTGWDSQLPGEGLLIWRVMDNKPLLEESHGIDGAPGPRLFPTSVPFPSASNDSFTPYTIPSSKGQLGGGLPVWITNIRRLPDGRVTFHIGYEYQ